MLKRVAVEEGLANNELQRTRHGNAATLAAELSVIPTLCNGCGAQLKRVRVAYGVLAVALACGTPQPPSGSPVPILPVSNGAKVPEAPRVSLVQVIASPDAFNGKRVTVFGWGNIEFEGDALYFHEEDFRSLLLTNAVRLSIPESIRKPIRDQQGYMAVVGTFQAADPMSRRLPYRGTITVEFVERIPSREEFLRKSGAPERPQSEQKRPAG